MNLLGGGNQGGICGINQWRGNFNAWGGTGAEVPVRIQGKAPVGGQGDEVCDKQSRRRPPSDRAILHGKRQLCIFEPPLVA